MHLTSDHPYNVNFLRMAMIVRNVSGRWLAEMIGVKPKQVFAYMGGQEPAADIMAKICDALQFPRSFFYRPGDFPERDPRYPPDMYVPLKPSAEPLRAQIIELVALIPDDDLPALFSMMHEMAEVRPECGEIQSGGRMNRLTDDQRATLLTLRSDAAEVADWVRLALERDSLWTLERTRQLLVEMLDRADALLETGDEADE